MYVNLNLAYVELTNDYGHIQADAALAEHLFGCDNWLPIAYS